MSASTQRKEKNRLDREKEIAEGKLFRLSGFYIAEQDKEYFEKYAKSNFYLKGILKKISSS